MIIWVVNSGFGRGGSSSEFLVKIYGDVSLIWEYESIASDDYMGCKFRLLGWS